MVIYYVLEVYHAGGYWVRSDACLGELLSLGEYPCGFCIGQLVAWACVSCLLIALEVELTILVVLGGVLFMVARLGVPELPAEYSSRLGAKPG